MNGTELNAISAVVEPQGEDRRIAIAYAMGLERREKVLRNLRIPATGLSMLAGLKAISSLTHNINPLQYMIFWSNIAMFSIAWLMNVSNGACVSFIRQGLFVVPRTTSLVYSMRFNWQSEPEKIEDGLN